MENAPMILQKMQAHRCVFNFIENLALEQKVLTE